MTTRSDDVLLDVRDLVVRFKLRGSGGQFVHAVESMSFSIPRGTTVGLVGESGSGKSTVGNAIMRLVSATSGEIILDGRSVLDAPRREIKELRRQVAMVFQDPLAALDPRCTVEESVAEPMVIHNLGNRHERAARVREVMDLSGLSSRFLDRYPHELSGGQRQRVCIARALAVDPQLLILDEATASLDVSVQAQVMNLLRELQEEMGLSYLFISHDLAAVEYMSHEVLVMYLGRLVEQAPREAIYSNPGHPYTQALISAIPRENPVEERKRERIILEGDVPSPVSPPSGCVFRTRCPIAIDECAESVPEATTMGPDHQVACIRAGQQVTA